ncbi:MAG: anhydro-N-acetylmuramic acid kinase, partial [Chitinophagaceae bacterium]|nr:anhydro-N-acetylmuramic acid kinase [Chitinophagaceae bacterium]
MIYRAIGVMSGSSLDGLDIAFVEFQEQGGKWTYEINEADCYPYTTEWTEKLKNAINLPAREYQLLHTAYGHYIGQEINRFIDVHQLHYKV